MFFDFAIAWCLFLLSFFYAYKKILSFFCFDHLILYRHQHLNVVFLPIPLKPLEYTLEHTNQIWIKVIFLPPLKISKRWLNIFRLLVLSIIFTIEYCPILTSHMSNFCLATNFSLKSCPLAHAIHDEYIF